MHPGKQSPVSVRGTGARLTSHIPRQAGLSPGGARAPGLPSGFPGHRASPGQRAPTEAPPELSHCPPVLLAGEFCSTFWGTASTRHGHSMDPFVPTQSLLSRRPVCALIPPGACLCQLGYPPIPTAPPRAFLPSPCHTASAYHDEGPAGGSSLTTLLPLG